MFQVWVQTNVDTMKWADARTFRTRQAAHAWARRQGPVCFRVLAERDALRLPEPNMGSPAARAGSRSASPGA